MPLSRHDLEHLMQLARLDLSEQEQEPLTRDLDTVIAYMAQLAAVDVGNVQPMTHAGAQQMPLREDVIQPPPAHRGVESSAGAQGGFIRVPRIME